MKSSDCIHRCGGAKLGLRSASGSTLGGRSIRFLSAMSLRLLVGLVHERLSTFSEGTAENVRLEVDAEGNRVWAPPDRAGSSLK